MTAVLSIREETKESIANMPINRQRAHLRAQGPYEERRKMRHLLLATVVLAISPTASAQDVRYYEQDGITYREVRSTTQRPVVDVTYQNREETVYRQQVTTKFEDYSQLSYQPVTTYRWEPRWHGWWRIFRGPHVAYHLVPSTTWQAQAHTVRVPITQTQWVPETRVVQQPVKQLKMVEQPQVTRTAMGPAASQTTALNPPNRPAVTYIPPAQPQMATRPGTGIGGIARLE